MHVVKILDTLFSVITKESAISRNSGIAIFLIIQKFCSGPEILDNRLLPRTSDQFLLEHAEIASF